MHVFPRSVYWKGIQSTPAAISIASTKSWFLIPFQIEKAGLCRNCYSRARVGKTQYKFGASENKEVKKRGAGRKQKGIRASLEKLPVTKVRIAQATKYITITLYYTNTNK